jgi:oligoribonuclease NrnB/cAMP/cGMP phosphodiesterase (DHH superfamily)
VHHSGAILSWNFFHPHKKAPWLLRYIEDRDIWKWKLPNAKAILPAIDLIPQTFPDWNRAARDLERASGRHTYATQGKIALRQNTINVNRILKKMEVATFHGYTAGVVNSPILEDDLGDAMRTLGYPIAIIWRRDKGNIRVSLRSSIRVDVAKLAAKHGGGGHRAASGFSFPADKRVPWRYTKGNGRKTL